MPFIPYWSVLEKVKILLHHEIRNEPSFNLRYILTFYDFGKYGLGWGNHFVPPCTSYKTHRYRFRTVKIEQTARSLPYHLIDTRKFMFHISRPDSEVLL